MDTIGCIAMPEQLRTSFINNVAGLVLPVTLALCFCVLSLLSLSVYFIYDAYTANSSYKQKESQIEKLRKKELSINQKSLVLPSSEELKSLNESVEKINDVGSVKGRNISNLLSEMELLLPKSAYIRKLDHNRQQGIVLLVAESDTVDQLTAFLKSLEGSGAFAKVLLTRQNRDKVSGMYQYELRLVEASL